MSVDLSKGGSSRLSYDISGLVVKPENEELVASVLNSVRQFLWFDLSLILESGSAGMPRDIETLMDGNGNITFPMSEGSRRMLSDLMVFEVVSEIVIQNTVNIDIKSVTWAFDQDDIEPFGVTDVVREMGLPANSAGFAGKRGKQYKLQLQGVNDLIGRYQIDEKPTGWQSYKTSHDTEYWNKSSRPTLYSVCYDTDDNRAAVAIASVLQDCTGRSSEFGPLYKSVDFDQWEVPEDLDSILIPHRVSKGKYMGLY